MQSVTQQIESRYKKHSTVSLKSGDNIRVHQKIIEGGKERIQVFEGLVIKVGRSTSLTATFTVRRIASGVGVEKTYLLHSPKIAKIEITKRSKVRRNYLSYMRDRTGKSARLSGVDFDKRKVNTVEDAPEPVAEVVEESTEVPDTVAEEQAEVKTVEAEKPAKAE